MLLCCRRPALPGLGGSERPFVAAALVTVMLPSLTRATHYSEYLRETTI